MRLALGLAISFLVSGLHVTSGHIPQAAVGDKNRRDLEPNKAIEREISGARTHVYVINLAKGDYCFVAVDQRGVDVAVTVLAPNGKKVAQVDDVDGPSGSEFVHLIAQAAGIYTFVVRAADKGQGRYEITLREVRPANADDEQFVAELARSDAVRFNDNGALSAAKTKRDLYPADADAKKEIDQALSKAAAEQKRVMLVFGGNWCYDCHVLDRALHEGTAGRVMKEGYVLVHVDIGEGNKNLDLLKKFRIPLEKGVPAVAILSGDGQLLYSSGDGEFEAARRMMKKDLVAFLLTWKPPL